jgi:hypothetical protein
LGKNEEMKTMRPLLVSPVLILVAGAAFGDVTLKCDAEQRCDGYLKNCVVDPYSLTVHIEPEKGLVTVGSRQIKADFSNPAEVAFPFTKYKVLINRYEHSAHFVSQEEVRIGWCKKVEPAW